jgi:hypothetical protein
MAEANAGSADIAQALVPENGSANGCDDGDTRRLVVRRKVAEHLSPIGTVEEHHAAPRHLTQR